MYDNSKNKLVLSVFVLVFAAFTLAGLAVVPSLQEANAIDSELLKDKPKKPKKHDFSIDEPVVELVKKKCKKRCGG